MRGMQTTRTGPDQSDYVIKVTMPGGHHKRKLNSNLGPTFAGAQLRLLQLRHGGDDDGRPVVKRVRVCAHDVRHGKHTCSVLVAHVCASKHACTTIGNDRNETPLWRGSA
jgi:hypothetical protein